MGRYSESNRAKYPVYFVVNIRKDGNHELEQYGVLSSANAKKIEEASTSSRVATEGGDASPVLTSSTISIADLLDLVKNDFSAILPNGVLEHYGIVRRNNELTNDIRFAVENGRIKFTPEHQRIYDELMQKYGTHPQGTQPRARDIEVPQAISDTQKVSRNARTFMEAEATPDEALSEFGKAILDGKMGGGVITDKEMESEYIKG